MIDEIKLKEVLKDIVEWGIDNRPFAKQMILNKLNEAISDKRQNE